MLDIELISPGKTKEKWLKSALAEYEKRLKPFCKFNLREIKEFSSQDKKKRVENESKKLAACLGQNIFPVLFDLKGKALTSEQFAEFLDDRLNGDDRKIAFFIGGAYGVDEHLKSLIPTHFSFSGMTFTHQMSRLICLEQIYRAFSILNKIPYHH